MTAEQTATARPKTVQEIPKTYYGRDAQRESQQRMQRRRYWSDMDHSEFVDRLTNIIKRSFNKVMQEPQLSLITQPASGVNQPRCYTKAPAEKQQDIEPEPTTPCQGGNLEIHVQKEEDVPALCDHVCDLIKAEGVFDKALVVRKESPETLIEQGGFISSFSYELLIKLLMCV